MSQQPLNETEEAFVERYCTHFTAARAAREIGIQAAKAGRMGVRLRNRPHVAARIKAIQDARSTEAEVLADRAIAEMADIATSSLTNFIRIDADGIPQLDLSRSTARDLATLDVLRIRIKAVGHGLDRGVSVGFHVKLRDKMRALGWLLRLFSLSRPRLSHQRPAAPRRQSGEHWA